VEREYDVWPTLAFEHAVRTAGALCCLADAAAPPARAWRAWTAIGSRSGEQHAEHWCSLAVFQAIGDDPQRQCLYFRKRFLAGLAVGKDAWQVDHIGQPATILLLLYFNPQWLSAHWPKA